MTVATSDNQLLLCKAAVCRAAMQLYVALSHAMPCHASDKLLHLRLVITAPNPTWSVNT
jgi:hypothetical protein